MHALSTGTRFFAVVLRGHSAVVLTRREVVRIQPTEVAFAPKSVKLLGPALLVGSKRACP